MQGERRGTMKVLRVSDEDFAAIASMVALTDQAMFQRLFIPATKRPRKEAKVLELTGTDLDYFMAAWKSWPEEVKTTKWVPGQGFEKRTVLKGSRQMAMENFKAMLSQATARELYAASVAYLLESPSVKEGFVQNVSTFYGSQKATVLEWLDRARQMIAEQDNHGE
jgi:hypothetical protein